MPRDEAPSPDGGSSGLAGRTAVVTGAGSGIGRAVAMSLADAGATVVAIGRRPSPLDDVVCEITARGGSARALAADVTDPGMVGALDAAAPSIDVLVAGAAAYAPYARLAATSPEDWATVHATVVDGTRRLVQHALPGMIDRRFGRIVAVGSLVAGLGGAGQGPYATAKAALVGLIRTVALETARHGVTANVVEPGLIQTDRVAAAVTADARQRIVAGIPAGRLGTPAEVAHAVAFLASPAASYVTGVVLPVAGGLGLGLGTGGGGRS